MKIYYSSLVDSDHETSTTTDLWSHNENLVRKSTIKNIRLIKISDSNNLRVEISN